MKKRMTMIAVLMMLVISLAMFTATAGADGESQSCGNGVTWTLSDTGVLAINYTGNGTEGTPGVMTSHPWTETQAADVEEVVIGEGVTEICAEAFAGCTNLTEITVPASMELIGVRAVNGCSQLTTVHYNKLALDWDMLIFSGEGLDALSRDTITLDCIQESAAGDDAQVSFTHVRAEGEEQDLVLIQDDSGSYYSVDVNKTVFLSVFAPKKEGYTVSYRLNEGSIWWSALEPNQTTETTAEYVNYETTVYEGWQGHMDYTVKAVYLPESGNGPALVSECGVQFRTVSHGDSGISASIPYHYIKPQNPEAGDGLSITIQVPDGVEVFQEDVWALTYRNGEEFYIEPTKAGDHTYIIPDSGLTAAETYYITADVYPIGFDRYYYTQEVPVLDEAGNDITLTLKDGENQATGTLQTGKAYTLTVSTTDETIQGIKVWTGTEWDFLEGQGGEIPVFFLRAGTYALSAYGTTGQQENMWPKQATPIKVTAESTKGPLSVPTVTTNQTEYQSGDGIAVTLTQPAGADGFYLKIVTADMDKSVWATRRVSATEGDTLTSIFPSSFLETDAYYMFQVESYGAGYEASTAYSAPFLMSAETDDPVAGILPVPICSTNISEGTVERGDVIHITFGDCPVIAGVTVQPDIYYSANLYDMSTEYGDYLGGWGISPKYLKEILIPTDDLTAGRSYRIDLLTEANGWESGSTSIEFTVTEPENNPVAFRMTKAPRIFEKTDIVLYVPGAKWLQVEISREEEGNQVIIETMGTAGNAGAWSWMPRSTGNFTLTPRAFSDMDRTNEITNIGAEPITFTVTSSGPLDRAQLEDYPTSIETGEDLDFTFYAVNHAERYHISLGYSVTESGGSWERVDISDIPQPTGATETTLISATVSGEYFTQEGYYILGIEPMAAGYESSWASCTIHAEEGSSTWSWTINDAETLFEGATMTISGTGEIPDYENVSDAPWWKNAQSTAAKVNRIIIDDGITGLGKNSLAGFGGTLRVDFMHSARPEIDEDAFGSGSAVCRYFDNTTAPESWTGTFNGQVSWMYLPFQPTSTITISYHEIDGDDGPVYGWTVGGAGSPFENEIEITAAQAKELTFAQRWVDLSVIPTAAEDRAVYEGMDAPTRLSFWCGNAEEYVLDLSNASRAPEWIECNSDGLRLKVIAPAGSTLEHMVVRDGASIIYNGNVGELVLSNSLDEEPAALTINGDISEVLYYTMESGYESYRGSFTLNGTIGHMTVYGQNEIYVPGISIDEDHKVTIDDMPCMTYDNLTRTGESPLITWNADTEKTELYLTEGETGIPVSGLTLDMFTYDYTFREDGVVSFSLNPKEESGLGDRSADIYNIRDGYNPNFGPDDIIRGDDTVIYIRDTGTGENDTITLGPWTDGEGVDRIYLQNCRAEINCPVTGTLGVWQYSFDGGPVYVTINDDVRELVLVLNRAGGLVTVGQTGIIEGGYQTLGVRGLRHFGTIRGASTLAADGQLSILTRKDGQRIRSLPAKDSDVTAAVKEGTLNEGEIARMDINDAELTEAEQTILDSYLTAQAAADHPMTVEEVIDVSVDAYSFIAGGSNDNKERSITSLEDPVTVQIGNDTGKTVGVVRLHEEEGIMTATLVTEEMTGGSLITFESDLFSKYVIVTNGEAADPLPCGDGVTWILSDGVLTISYTGSGTGAMTSHPWTDRADEITTVIIGEGVTSICEEAFAGCSNMTSITIPGTIHEFPGAFEGCTALTTIHYGGIQKDWDNFLCFVDGPGYRPVMMAQNRTFRASEAIGQIEGYSFAFTAAKADGGTLEETDSGSASVTRYLYENYEDVIMTLDAPNLAGYTKTYRVEMDNPTVRLNPGLDGRTAAYRETLIHATSAWRNIWFRAYAIYVPDDETKPVLIAESKMIEFQVTDLKTLEVTASSPTGYALGIAGGCAVTVEIPESVDLTDLVGWSLRVFDDNYNTIFMRPTLDDTLVLQTGINTIQISDNVLQAGKRYTIQFTMAVKGYEKYVYEKGITIVGEGEDPSKVLAVPEISVNANFYYAGEKVKLTLGKVENAETYTLHMYNRTDLTEYYSCTLTSADFGDQGSIEIQIPTAELPVTAYYRIETECSASGYVGSNNETEFWLYAARYPQILSISSPETYTKKRLPTETDGLAVTVKVHPSMRALEAEEWTLSVYDEEENSVYTLVKQDGDTYTGSFVIPEKDLTNTPATDILEAGKTYTYTLYLKFAGYTAYNSDVYSFTVLSSPEDSVSCEPSTYYTPEGQKQALYITAYGPIASDNAALWAEYAGSTDMIVLNGDITSIGDNAFAGFTKDGLRIDFNQSGMPEISNTAFSGCSNIVCRYYSSNNTWTGGNYGAQSMRWVYLPVHAGTFDGQSAYFDYTENYGWSYKLFNNETYGRDRYPMTVEQAEEIAVGKYKVIEFYALPSTAAEQAFYAGWEHVQRITIMDGVTGELTISLPEYNNLYEMTIDSHYATVNITNPETLQGLKCRSGVVNYTGNIQNLTLDGAEATTDSLTVNGYIDTLSFNDATAESPYKGDMTLTGAIGHGAVQGKGSLTIPGVGKKEFGNLTHGTFNYLESEDEPLTVIEDGVLQVESTQFQVSLDMYDLTYFVSDTYGGRMISLGLQAMGEYQEILGNDYLRYNNLNITSDDFVYGENTSITIQASSDVGPVVLNGEQEGGETTGVGSIYFMHGQATVNCPVGSLTIDNGSEFTEGIILTINSEVDYLDMSDLNSGSITLGESGKVNSGYWNRRSRANRNFGTVSTAGTLYARGSLNAMSWREDETLKALLPAEDVIATAAGLGTGVMASADVSESSRQELSQAESDALDSFLATNGGTVTTIFDTSISTYTLDGDGNVIPGAAITELEESVPFTVSNDTGEPCYVVRLHENASGIMTAESLTEPTDDETIEFESDRFSKYALISTAEGSISYEFGQNTNYYVKGEWTLRITGRGNIPSYESAADAPWSADVAGKENIRIVIGDRITGIGANAFANLGGTTRVDFPGATMPIVDADAFAGSTVICHYYKDNESWAIGTAGRTDAEWLFLPRIYEEEYPGVGSIDYIQPEGAAQGWYSYINDTPYQLSMAQAEEMSYNHLTVWLYEIPTETDAVLYTTRNIPWRAYVLDNCSEGTLNLDASHGGNTLEMIDLSASQVTVNVVHADTYWPVFTTRVSDGTLNYTGNTSELELINSFTGNIPSVTVHGNIGTLVFHNIDSDQAYIGDLEVAGTIISGTEFGSGTLSIPGVGTDIEVNAKVREFSDLTMAEGDGKLIENGVFQRTDIPAIPHSLADYRLEYMFRDQEGTEFDDTTLTLTPKSLGGQGIEIDILEHNPDFTENDIIWGPDTSISVHWWDPSNQNHQLTLNGGTDAEGNQTGFYELFNNSSYGTVTVNCPVDTIGIYQADGRGDAITLQVNNTVNRTILKMRGNGSVIRLGENGHMYNISWERYLHGTRFVQEVHGPCTLVADGRFCVLSNKDGEELKSILPGDADLATAAGMEAVMDISESEGLNENEQAEINEMLSGTTDEVETVFEVSVTGYAGGIEGGAGTILHELGGEVQMAVENTTGGQAYVARLHEENGELTATAVSEPTTDSVLLFESDRFSKYVIIAAGEAFDPSGLNTLTLPASLTRIEEEAFAGNIFQVVIIPDTCTYIGPKAFENCPSLIYVSYPEGCEIDEHAFDGCINLEYLIKR